MTTTAIMALFLSLLCGASLLALWINRRLRAEHQRSDALRTQSEDLRCELECARATAQAHGAQLQHARDGEAKAELALDEQRRRAHDNIEALRAQAVLDLASAQEAKAVAEQRAAVLYSSLDGRDRELADLQRTREDLRTQLEKRDRDLKEYVSQLSTAREQRAGQAQRIEELEKLDGELRGARAKFEEVRTASQEQQELVARLQTQLDEEKRSSVEKLDMHRQLHGQLEEKFKGIAAQVLQANTEKFENNTKSRLGELSEGLRTQVKELQAKVEHTHHQDSQDRAALRNELQRMVDASKRIDQDAVNLTRALIGDRKAQGAWGELVLDRVLTQCGLREGEEYSKQTTFTDDDNRRLRPDVVVSLPDGRAVIIDAKVSLTAYNEYVSAENDDAAEQAIARHLTSVRTHIKLLADKDYWSLNALKTVDYVLMFVPIESAFADALRNDAGLFEDAFQRHVILVSPTTLLATLRTIEHTWRVERQNETARAIAEQAGKLYDKFEAFVAELQKVGTRLEQAKLAYDGAIGKLSTGRGNLLRQAEQIRVLGVKVKKQLPAELVELACDGLAFGSGAEEAEESDERDPVEDAAQ